jgi:CheY-like chemotaxis protein
MPARVMMDPAQLEQIVVNLAVNARDAMPRGGELLVETRYEPSLGGAPGRAVAGLPHQGAWAMLRVEDSGVGMSPETLSRLFEPFFTTKPAGSGTGLGLATSYGIARQAGGAIHVRSEVGKGSAFEVLLPAVEAESRVARLSPVGTPVMTGGTPNAIAVVDADPAVRDLVGRTLRDLGYRVHLAPDVDALGEVRRQLAGCLRLLITDGAPGSEAERGLRSLGVNGPAVPVPVVRLHRHAAPGAGEGDNGARWLSAPFTADELVDAVRDALGHGARA